MAQQDTNFLEHLKKICLERAPQTDKEVVATKTFELEEASKKTSFVDLALH